LDFQEKEILSGSSEDRQLALRELADTYSELGEIYSNESLELSAKYAFQLSQALQNAELSKRQVNSLQRSASVNAAGIARQRKENAAHLEKCADLLLKLNRLSAAENLYLLALSLRVLTNDQSAQSNDELAVVQIKLGNYYRNNRKNFHEAEKRYQAALTTLSHSRTQSTIWGQALTQLGSLYANDLKKPAEGEKLLKQALTMLSTLPASEGPTFLTLGELADLYLDQSRFAEAVEANRRKLTLAHALLKSTSPKLTGSEKWSAEDYTDVFKNYVTAVNHLIAAQLAAGDPSSAASASGFLIDPELRIGDVVDPKVLTEYANMLVKHRESLPAAAAQNLEERLAAIEVRKKYIQAVLEYAD
jgi:tetratricopeptide (TPR) repeat protein